VAEVSIASSIWLSSLLPPLRISSPETSTASATVAVVASTLQALTDRQPPRRRRRRRGWLALVLLALIVLVAAGMVRAETESTPPLLVHRTLAADVRLPGRAFVPAWPAEGEAAVEVEGVGSLGTSGKQTPVPIASVAKVMTAYLTLREHPLVPGEEGFRVRITPADVAEERERVALDESTVNVKAGERLSERQALEALMLPSANNVAALLAVHDAGSIPAFVARMNETARELGMDSTVYTDPSGFDEGTVSTASDQLKLARTAMEDKEFAQIVDEPSARLPVVGRVINYNELVGSSGYVGIKTGSDEAAGGCLLFAKRLNVGGRTLMVLGVVLGQHDGELVDAALASAGSLAGSVAGAVHFETALPAGSKVLTAENADGARVAVRTAAPLREIGWPGLRLPAQVAVRTPQRQLDAGERLATVTVRGASVAHGAALASHPLASPSLRWRLLHLF
jgi:serine-type D-Ala-D-Ala carboxypeptidase (penicillin-binding protein 5/6)